MRSRTSVGNCNEYIFHPEPKTEFVLKHLFCREGPNTSRVSHPVHDSTKVSLESDTADIDPTSRPLLHVNSELPLRAAPGPLKDRGVRGIFKFPSAARLQFRLQWMLLHRNKMRLYRQVFFSRLTSDRSYATVVRPSVCRLWRIHCG